MPDALRSIGLFVLAALAEIGGAWLVWQGVREHRGVAFIGAGIAALAAYGFVATLQPDANFGRILPPTAASSWLARWRGDGWSTASAPIASISPVRPSAWWAWP